MTEHLVVELFDEDLVCRGTLDDMESQVVRVADFLGVGVPAPIHVYYGVAAVDEFCGDRLHIDGCAWGPPEDSRIASSSGSIYHELVHGVRSVNDVLGTRFFEEGLARVLEVPPFARTVDLDAAEVQPGPAELATLVSADFENRHYGIAAHFLLWLFDVEGSDSVVPFLDDPGYTRAANVEGTFAAHFGMTLEESEAEWRASSPDHYEWGQQCEPQRWLEWVGPTVTFAGRLDCSDHDTSGPVNGDVVSRGTCFDVAEPATLEVQFDGADGRVDMISVDCEWEEGLTPEHYQSKRVVAGERVELPFAACGWLIHVFSPLESADDFSVRLTRPE